MSALFTLFTLILTADLDAPKRVIVGGSSEVRAALEAVGIGESTWDHSEIWIDRELVVWVSKDPYLCARSVREAVRADPDYSLHAMRVLRLMVPKDADLAQIFFRQRILMVKQIPGGTSCGWRVLEPGEDWESVPAMKRTRTIGSCADALDFVAKLGVSDSVQLAVKNTLQKPKPLNECRR